MYCKHSKHDANTKCHDKSAPKYPQSSLHIDLNRGPEHRNILNSGFDMVFVCHCYDNFRHFRSLKCKNTVHNLLFISFFIRISHFSCQFSVDINPVCGKDLLKRKSPCLFFFRQNQNHPIGSAAIGRGIFVTQFHSSVFSNGNIPAVISGVFFQHIWSKKFPRKILPFSGQIMQFPRCFFLIQTENSLNGLLSSGRIFIVHAVHQKKCRHG